MADNENVSASTAANTTVEEEAPKQRVVSAEIGEMTELESMCPRCEDNGITRLMFTTLPHFKEVIVSSFECPHCGERNNEVQFGGCFGEKHVRYELQVKNEKDMSRQLVKSEWASLSIPEIDFEIPARTQPGLLTTVEGIISRAADGLAELQPVRRVQDPALAAQIDSFIEKLNGLRDGKTPFTIELNDPAGNSYIEAIHDYYHPTIDPQLTKFERPRTEIDRQMCGLAIDYNTSTRTAAEEAQVDAGQLDEVLNMVTSCSACGKEGFIKMHACNIPHFQETIIMAFKCDYCGYKSNEIKAGGAIPPKGKRIVLKVEEEDDLKRDLLKSSSASLEIPELELELAPGTLGGFFTSVEGLLEMLKRELGSLPQAVFESGDSAGVNESIHEGGLKGFVVRIERLITGKHPFTVILDDPMNCIYIQNPRDHLPPPDNIDPRLEITEYVRSFDQDEELGIHDMHVEGYEQHHETEQHKHEEEEKKE